MPIFAYSLSNYTPPKSSPEGLFDQVLELAQAAEVAGFDLVTVFDHVYQVGQENDPMLEAYSTLAAIAARTTRIGVGTLVTGVTYRNPALLAKTVTTLDVISKGRAFLGIGAAWYASEHTGYGFTFPPIAERMDRLDEAIRICKLMFTTDRPSFHGKYYFVDRAVNSPRPIQLGGPRILVGGGGEKRTLQLAARHADMTHWAGPLDTLKHKSDVLLQHCIAERRDPSTILRMAVAPYVLGRNQQEARLNHSRLPLDRQMRMKPATLEQAAEGLRLHMDAGFGGFTFDNWQLSTREELEMAGELKTTLATERI